MATAVSVLGFSAIEATINSATLHFDSNSVIRKPAQRAGCLLKKILQVIGLRVSHQAESIKNQNNIFKAHEEKYQSRINALETLAAGATEENKVVSLLIELGVWNFAIGNRNAYEFCC